MYLKLSNPTKVELRKPFVGLKSWKAITPPKHWNIRENENEDHSRDNHPSRKAIGP